MKSKSKSKSKSVRYSPDQIKAICAFMRSGKTAIAAKQKFGCSSHYAGALRKEHGIKLVTPTAAPSKKAKAKPAKKAKKGRK